jgi:hypothetical protein
MSYNNWISMVIEELASYVPHLLGAWCLNRDALSPPPPKILSRRGTVHIFGPGQFQRLVPLTP